MTRGRPRPWLSAVIDLCSRAAQLAAEPDTGKWPMKLMQAVLQLAGHDLRQFTEKKEFVAAAKEYLRELPPRIQPPGGGGRWLPMPSLFARPEPVAAEGQQGTSGNGEGGAASAAAAAVTAAATATATARPPAPAASQQKAAAAGAGAGAGAAAAGAGAGAAGAGDSKFAAPYATVPAAPKPTTKKGGKKTKVPAPTAANPLRVVDSDGRGHT